jgi:hypothetical protein
VLLMMTATPNPEVTHAVERTGATFGVTLSGSPPQEPRLSRQLPSATQTHRHQARQSRLLLARLFVQPAALPAPVAHLGVVQVVRVRVVEWAALCSVRRSPARTDS